jgi:hypothetical protein
VTGSCEHVSLVPMLRISGATLLPPMCIHGMETDNFIFTPPPLKTVHFIIKPDRLMLFIELLDDYS